MIPIGRAAIAALLLMSSGLAQYFRGVNVSGAEFGEMHLPGAVNTDYTYNSESTFRYFGGKNLGLIRLPVKWERLQPRLRGPLDPANLAAVKKVVAWAKAHGGKLIIEPHNFARYSMNEGGTLNTYTIDNAYGGVVRVTAADLADFWVRLSNEFRDEAGVYAYDLMNEPHDMGSASWKTISQTVLTAIRSNADAKLVMVPGDNWSAANTWPRVHGAASWITDPADNFAYEAHQYFDSDNSGRYARTYDEELAANRNLASIGPARLAPFVDWCRANNVRGYLGEYGIPNTDARWLSVLDGFLAALDAAGLDGTYWAAGEWWGNYALSVQPLNKFTTDRVQMPVLQAHLPPMTFSTVSAASFNGAIVAPDSLATGFGKDLGAAAEVEIAGVNGSATPANLIYVSASQINYLVPAGLPSGHYEVAVNDGRGTIARGNLEVDAVAPALFAANGTGRGLAAAQILRVRPDGTEVYESAAEPIDFGDGSSRLFVVLYGTGFRSAANTVSLTIGNVAVPVLFAGAQPDYPGLDQVNAELPRSLAGTGPVDAALIAAGVPANTVTLNFR